MDLSSILNSTKKKTNSSFDIDDNSSEQIFQSSPTPTPSNSSNESVDDSNYLAKEGGSSTVELTNVGYNHDEDKQIVELTIGRLDNTSDETTGDIRIYCWLSEKRYNFEDGFGNDNNCLIGEQFLGHLEQGYGFPDVKCTFKIPDDIFPVSCRWHFVFTINEYHVNDKWYIIDYRNGECHLADDDYNSIVGIISYKLDVDRSDVKYDSNIFNDLGADSLDAVELIMEFEKEFGISISDEEAEQIRTVGDIVEYLVDHL